jgi:hypothetical protein
MATAASAATERPARLCAGACARAVCSSINLTKGQVREVLGAPDKQNAWVVISERLEEA